MKSMITYKSQNATVPIINLIYYFKVWGFMLITGIINFVKFQRNIKKFYT